MPSVAPGSIRPRTNRIDSTTYGIVAVTQTTWKKPTACRIVTYTNRNVDNWPALIETHSVVMHGSYLADDRCVVTDAHPRRLRSADTRTLLVSRTLTNLGDRAFSAAGPRVWNYLPTDFRQPDLYSSFRQSLKTILLCQWHQSAVWIAL